MAETIEKKVSLTVADRRSVWLRSTFLQGSWKCRTVAGATL